MKIAILSVYSGVNNRGVESFCHNLASTLSQKGLGITVFQTGKTDAVSKYSQIEINQKIFTNNLPVNHLLKRLFIDSSHISEFLFFLKVLPFLNNFDIIVPLVSGWPIPILRLLTWIKNKRMVMIGQSGPGWDDRFNLFWKPDLFVCLTQTQQKWAQKASFWTNQKFSVIPNGVDLVKFSTKGKKAIVNLEKPIILTTAASTTAKRINTTIKAISQLKKGSLLLLGKGELDKELDKLGISLLGNNRYLHLSLPHEDVPSYFRSADLFTLCSASSEAFGIVYIEALASGLGCVATDDDSRREIIKDAGIYVKNPEDSDQYAKALSEALAKNWQALATKQALNYSWDKVSDSYYHEFKKLLN